MSPRDGCTSGSDIGYFPSAQYFRVLDTPES